MQVFFLQKRRVIQLLLVVGLMCSSVAFAEIDVRKPVLVSNDTNKQTCEEWVPFDVNKDQLMISFIERRNGNKGGAVFAEFYYGGSCADSRGNIHDIVLVNNGVMIMQNNSIQVGSSKTFNVETQDVITDERCMLCVSTSADHDNNAVHVRLVPGYGAHFGTEGNLFYRIIGSDIAHVRVQSK